MEPAQTFVEPVGPPSPLDQVKAPVSTVILKDVNNMKKTNTTGQLRPLKKRTTQAQKVRRSKKIQRRKDNWEA